MAPKMLQYGKYLNAVEEARFSFLDDEISFLTSNR
jgi:hypothetical protein